MPASNLTSHKSIIYLVIKAVSLDAPKVGLAFHFTGNSESLPSEDFMVFHYGLCCVFMHVLATLVEGSIW